MLEEANRLTNHVDNLLNISGADASQNRTASDRLFRDGSGTRSHRIFEVLVAGKGQQMIMEGD